MPTHWVNKLYDRYKSTEQIYIDKKNGVTRSVFDEGDDAMMRFARSISSVPGKRLWDAQKIMLDPILSMIISHAYYNQWPSHRDVILRRYGWTSQTFPIMITAEAPRRGGKSTTMQLVAACLVTTMPTRKTDYAFGVGVVSVNMDASKKMLADIHDIIQLMPNLPKGIQIYVTTKFIGIIYPDGRQNRIYGFQTGKVSNWMCGVVWCGGGSDGCIVDLLCCQSFDIYIDCIYTVFSFGKLFIDSFLELDLIRIRFISGKTNKICIFFVSPPPLIECSTNGGNHIGL